ncbi:hypothetical protein KC953_02635 [Candidatus Saccharibacteria bacterium]|nr:hypothetical protein [Candidatus Saccharibacteria bacterium]
MAKKAPMKLGGFLLFFVLVFVFGIIGEISTFFFALGKDTKTTVDTINIIASPILAVALLVSTLLIVQHKKSALSVIYVTLVMMTLYTIVYNLNTNDASLDSMRFIGLITAPVLYVVIGLYFHHSNRVKQTLVN